MKNKSTTFYLMIASMFVRLFWLVFFEPRGAARAAIKTQQMGELAQLASSLIPYIVYPSIALLIVIIILSFMRRKSAFIGATVFGFVHLILIAVLLVMGVSPGMGFLVVMPASLGMIIFSSVCFKEYQARHQPVPATSGAASL